MMLHVNNLNQHFKFLDELPESLYRAVVTLSHGSLRQRVNGILHWREKLLCGQFPDIDSLDWPAYDIREIILRRLDGLEIIDQCKNEESLVDQILISICEAIESIINRRQQSIHGLFDDVLDKPFRKRQKPSDIEPEKNDGPDAPSSVDTEQQNSSNPQSPADNQSLETPEAHSSIHDAAGFDESSSVNQQYQEDLRLSHEEKQIFANRLEQVLKDSAQQWQELRAIIEGMATTPGRGWDLSRGELKQQAWREVVYYRSLIKSYPQLLSIVNSLGRMREGDKRSGDEQTVVSQSSEKEQLFQSIETIVTTPDPMAIQGVKRSDDVARMLPSEAAYLSYPKLQMLWHAKRAEQALLCYLADGVLSEHQLVEFPEENTKVKSASSQSGKHTTGPILLCLDTSGSMKGEPEKLAKALSLEVIRLANQEKRDCYLFAFSGPGQIIEQQLKFTPFGLKQIVQFLQSSFHGGTDVAMVMQRALQKSRHRHWQKADILLVTDGLFQVSESLISQVKQAKKSYGIRVHGLLINGWRTEGVQKICQPLHVFDEWQVSTNINTLSDH